MERMISEQSSSTPAARWLSWWGLPYGDNTMAWQCDSTSGLTLFTPIHTHFLSYSLHSVPFCAGRGHGSCYSLLAHCAPQSSSLTHVVNIHHWLKEKAYERGSPVARETVRKRERGKVRKNSTEKERLCSPIKWWCLPSQSVTNVHVF